MVRKKIRISNIICNEKSFTGNLMSKQEIEEFGPRIGRCAVYTGIMASTDIVGQMVHSCTPQTVPRRSYGHPYILLNSKFSHTYSYVRSFVLSNCSFSSVYVLLMPSITEIWLWYSDVLHFLTYGPLQICIPFVIAHTSIYRIHNLQKIGSNYPIMRTDNLLPIH